MWVRKGAIAAIQTFGGAWVKSVSKAEGMGKMGEILDRPRVAPPGARERTLAKARAEEERARAKGAAGLRALASIVSAQALFREGDKDGDGVRDYALSLAELAKAGLIAGTLTRGVSGGHTVETCVGSEAPSTMFMAVASRKSGPSHFAVNHEGVIHAKDSPFELDRKACKIKGGKPVER